MAGVASSVAAMSVPRPQPVTMDLAAAGSRFSGGGGSSSTEIHLHMDGMTVVSPKPELAGKMVRRAVLEGLHTNDEGFRTTIIRKVGKR